MFHPCLLLLAFQPSPGPCLALMRGHGGSGTEYSDAVAQGAPPGGVTVCSGYGLFSVVAAGIECFILSLTTSFANYGAVRVSTFHRHRQRDRIVYKRINGEFTNIETNVYVLADTAADKTLTTNGTLRPGGMVGPSREDTTSPNKEDTISPNKEDTISPNKEDTVRARLTEAALAAMAVTSLALAVSEVGRKRTRILQLNAD